MMTYFRPFIAGLTLLIGLPAHAATFDFAAIADMQKTRHNGVEQHWEDKYPNGLTRGGITVQASSEQGYIHLDGAHYGAPPAGLGVCQLADCSGRWQDGIEMGEVLKLSFSERIDITDVFFRWSSPAYVLGDDPDHLDLFGEMAINGEVFMVRGGRIPGLHIENVQEVEITPLLSSASVLGVSPYVSLFEVEPTRFEPEPEPEPSPVPVPASALLLLAGLGGFAAVRRKKR